MTEYAVWAPQQDRVRVLIDGTAHAMTSTERGWWRAEVEDDGPGTAYAFLLDDDETPLPDPRSQWQPDGVHEASRRYDQDKFWWTDQSWTGRALPGSVLYELHIGTFTDQGTFDAVIPRLDHLVSLGVDLVEVLPVNAFDGPRNWGYDGVGWYTVTENYGARTGSNASSTPRTRAGWESCSTSSTTTSGRPGPTWTGSGPTSRAATSGGPRSTSTARTPTRCAGT